MDLAAVKSNSGLPIAAGNRYNNAFCNGKSHTERVHFGWFWVRNDFEYAGEIAGRECFRLCHVFAVLTLFPLR